MFEWMTKIKGKKNTKTESRNIMEKYERKTAQI